ncbi:MAG: rRNA pseudouridine synthase, partial [Anaerolineales bacterium]|nr:rRNA pseudouridine synthase [Anaerolineales bacterium]
MEERLQKILAHAGLGSRRSCEELIQRGRVTVNGRLAVLGSKADPEVDRIEVNGKPIQAREPLKYIALNKPRNVISAAQPEDDRKTVRDLVDEPGTLYPVGRLDVDSTGLILLTNDGDLTNRLTHPKYKHEKEYRVLVASRPDEKQLTAWRNGVVLEDGYRTNPAQVRQTGTHGKGAWMQVILTEGKKRQIREMGRLTGLPVVRILRVRIASLQLGSLKPGQWRHLTHEEIQELKGDSPPQKPQKSRKTQKSPRSQKTRQTERSQKPRQTERSQKPRQT